MRRWHLRGRPGLRVWDAAPIIQWLSGGAAAWTEVLAALTPAERGTIVATMRAYEAALEKHVST